MVLERLDGHGPPQRFGRYEVSKVLGEGAFGRVYLAQDTQLGRQVALKVPSERLFDMGISVEAFLEEGRNAARVNHPGLVSVYDVQQHGQYPFIVQEYIDGCNMADWMVQHRLSYESLARLFLEIVRSLEVLHEHDLYHRDLKPGNILIDSSGRAHVADFGLAVHESARRNRMGQIAGTPAYMAPEQVKGETHRIDGRTDIWSIGVMLYEALLGERPFIATARDELFADIEELDARPPRQRNAGIPRELERICLKCLEKRRSDRYSCAADVAADLEHWIQNATTSTSNASAGTHVGSGMGSIPLSESADAQSALVMPKGLRSFDSDDAEFFLRLLPGPRDRDGLPQSVRFWKRHIEQTDPLRPTGMPPYNSVTG